jgi:hypothetical protein
VVVHAGLLTLAHDGAAAQREELPDEVEVDVHGLRAREGAEVQAAVPDYPAGAEDAGEFLVGDPYARVGLAVLEVDVVLGRVPLDEGVLEEEGLVFARREDPFDGLDPRDQVPGLHVLPSGEIGGKAVAQDLGLADVDDLAVGSAHYIDARRFRSLPREGPELGEPRVSGLPARFSIVHTVR